jgi:hypothetical protein
MVVATFFIQVYRSSSICRRSWFMKRKLLIRIFLFLLYEYVKKKIKIKPSLFKHTKHLVLSKRTINVTFTCLLSKRGKTRNKKLKKLVQAKSGPNFFKKNWEMYMYLKVNVQQQHEWFEKSHLSVDWRKGSGS